MKPIGRMDKQIALESKTQQNVSGSVREVWEDEGTEWAEIISEKGTEAFESAREQASAIIRARIHYRDDVGTGWRLLYGGEYYYVQSVDRTSRRKGELWFTALLTDAR